MGHSECRIAGHSIVLGGAFSLSTWDSLHPQWAPSQTGSFSLRVRIFLDPSGRSSLPEILVSPHLLPTLAPPWSWGYMDLPFRAAPEAFLIKIPKCLRSSISGCAQRKDDPPIPQ